MNQYLVMVPVELRQELEAAALRYAAIPSDFVGILIAAPASVSPLTRSGKESCAIYLLVLLLIVAFVLGNVLVRVENERYALWLGMCPNLSEMFAAMRAGDEEAWTCSKRSGLGQAGGGTCTTL